MAVTIKDVARLAEVSPSTVTRVIQDKPSISQATKKRVRQAMETLNYHPNFNARSLASNKQMSLASFFQGIQMRFIKTLSSLKLFEGFLKLLLTIII